MKGYEAALLDAERRFGPRGGLMLRNGLAALGDAGRNLVATQKGLAWAHVVDRHPLD